MNRLNSLFQADLNPYLSRPPIPLTPNFSHQYRISLLPESISKSFNELICERDEREKLARYVFRLEQMKNRLKATTMADLRERQEHLYDC